MSHGRPTSFDVSPGTVWHQRVLPFSLHRWLVVFLSVGWSLALRGQLTPENHSAFQQGKELSKKYCTSCHLWPNPQLLDKTTWRTGVMPLMTSRLGIDQLDLSDPGQKQVREEWDKIWEYYLAVAPDQSPPQIPHPKIEIGLKTFAPEKPAYRTGHPFITMTRIDASTRQIYVGNAESRTLDVLDQQGKPLSSLKLESPLVALEKRKEGWFGTLIGKVPPHEQSLGKIVLLGRTNDQFEFRSIVLSNLPRPTDTAFGDINGDGREDLVVSAFGHVDGRLSWFENLGDGKYAEQVLANRPGALRTELRDFDADGKLDIGVLMAQSREGFFLYLNDGGGKFTELVALEQPPFWGYAGFQLVDFDKDGLPDLLTANGDNGEYASCFKNYHGIRLYLNRAENGYKPTYFYPLNGAFKAIAADFDQDGDFDIAAISYFPDYAKSPEESFVYLENTGNNEFRAWSIPEAQLGRWLVMDMGDLDGDGDLDLVLGAANRTPYQTPAGLTERWEKEGPTLLILRNQTRRPKSP